MSLWLLEALLRVCFSIFNSLNGLFFLVFYQNSFSNNSLHHNDRKSQSVANTCTTCKRIHHFLISARVMPPFTYSLSIPGKSQIPILHILPDIFQLYPSTFFFVSYVLLIHWLNYKGVSVLLIFY